MLLSLRKQNIRYFPLKQREEGDKVDSKAPYISDSFAQTNENVSVTASK